LIQAQASMQREACPFLGVADDPETYSLIGDVDNYCYNRRPKASGGWSTSSASAWRGKAAQCLFYAPAKAPHSQPAAQQPASQSVPTAPSQATASQTAGASKTGQPANWQTGSWCGRLGFTGLLIVMASLTYFSFWARMDAQAAGAVQPVKAQFMPPSGVQQVLVHVVGRNESWSSVAALYDTSQAVLMTANPPGDSPGASLAPGRLLVVLPGITDPTGLRPLVAYWIPLPLRVAEAASKYGVSEEEIRFWNQTQGEWVEGQRWLVIGLPSLGSLPVPQPHGAEQPLSLCCPSARFTARFPTPMHPAFMIKGTEHADC
jgi:hypothetical protein